MTEFNTILRKKKEKKQECEKNFQNFKDQFGDDINHESNEFKLRLNNVSKSCSQITLNCNDSNNNLYARIVIDKKEAKHRIVLDFNERSIYENNIESFLIFIKNLNNYLLSFSSEFWLKSYKDHIRLHNAVNRSRNEIYKAQEEKKELEQASTINALKRFLASNKAQIKEEKNLFSNEKTFEKKLVNFEIYNDKISFRLGTLRVANEDKKRFYFCGSFISKAKAMKILESQVFVNDKTIENVQQVPHYKYESNNRYHYTPSDSYYTTDLHTYLERAKREIMRGKISDF